VWIYIGGAWGLKYPPSKFYHEQARKLLEAECSILYICMGDKKSKKVIANLIPELHIGVQNYLFGYT